jgi:DNA processing protein
LQTEKNYWLAAARLAGLGPVKFQHWLSLFGNMTALFNAADKDLHAAGIAAKYIYLLKKPDWQKVLADEKWLAKNNCQMITYQDELYPPLLKEIHDAPLILFVAGNADLLLQPQLAMVGSRNPSNSGREHADEFAQQLAQTGLIITSGLAAGVDTASHEGALKVGCPTIAVMGTGMRYIYPRTNHKLASIIKEQGAIVTEFLPDTPPKAKNFPARNRIISGLSLGVLVVEAAARSGSLITARCAIEQNREVFALPGSIHNPLIRGCHQLIRQGAKLVETIDDILDELKISHSSPATRQMQSPTKNLVDLTPAMQRVFDQVNDAVTPMDAIILRTGLLAGEVSSMLLLLELDGYVQIVPGGYARMQ